ncbi:MAG: primosomal protein N' [Burkholderiales bacterium]|nr:primosomal protein N' [Burkholderiales bacterium]
MTIVRVALDVPLPRLFDYRCDEATAADVGRQVRVRLGARPMTGLVLEVTEHSELPAERIRAVDALLRELPPLPPQWLETVRFCSEYYQRPIGEVVFTALPPRLRRAPPAAPQRRILALTSTGLAALESISPRHKLRRGLLEALREHPRVQSEMTRMAAGARKILAAMIEAGWIEARAAPPPPAVAGPAPNEEQRTACEAVAAAHAVFQVFLLYGITGSGKTEVYLRLIDDALARGRQVLVLAPEIALTPALEAAFRARFPAARIAVLHSGVGGAERARGWAGAQAGQVDIVLGTRLAVFTPLPKLGLAVVDEEQDASFKQREGLRYSARDLAIFRARQAGVPALLVSATPSLESFHHALSGRYRLLRLSRRAHGQARLPSVHLVDTREHPARDGLSEPLARALALRLSRKEQSLVFLNRRGFAPVLACNYCGWVSGCPRCSVCLVVHQRSPGLRCHHCGHAEPVPRACPQCGNLDLVPLGRGTQRLEASLAERFPGARIVRIDSDSASRRVSHLIGQAAAGEADMLVGTQMLAKGHHLERVTLVGVVNADAGLFAADYRAPERLFAQLEQVAGRAGRADLPGEVLIQTRFPTHPLYRALAAHDFDGYARQLLAERRSAGFPPFVHEAALRAECTQLADALEFLRQAVALAPAPGEGLTVFEPAPATLTRLAGLERAQLLVQSHSRPVLQRFLRAWSATLYARRAGAVRWHFDVDPIEF